MVPRRVEALDGKSVLSVPTVSTAGYYTMVCTKVGELDSFGSGCLGHGGGEENEYEEEPEPRLVEALAGKVVTGVCTGDYDTGTCHTVV